VKVYGIACYLAFLAAFALLVDFLWLGNFVCVDCVRLSSTDNELLERCLQITSDRLFDRCIAGVGPTGFQAIALDLALVALFGVVHSVMARASFKRAWTRIVPRSAERSTYVLVSSALLALMMWKWQGVGGAAHELWHLPEVPMDLAFFGGIVLVVVATFQTDHFDFFGLRQTWLGDRYTPVPFVERGLYRFMRHPLMVGLLLVFWATPVMTISRLALAIAMTVYIAVGVAFEERGLARELGEPYLDYRRRVRAFGIL
jgi:protein-S-isoprenylcysteine O-methyltransferase Ste14